MSDRIKFAVSATPIETILDENDGEHDVIAGEVGRSVGGNGLSVVTNYTASAAAQGFLNAAPNYKEATDDGSVAISSETGASFVFIKNTGKIFSTAAALGAAGTESVKVIVGTTMISILDPGEAIILKDDNAGINATNIDVQTVANDGSPGSVHMAVEYLVVN